MLNGLLLNSLFAAYRGQSTSTRLMSPRLWKEALGGPLSPDGFANGYFIGDDFRGFGDTYAVASNLGRYASEAGAYRSFEDTGNAISQLATERTGVVNILTDADDNSEAWLQYGQATSVSSVISTTAGADKLLIFEARIRPSQVTAGNLFFGLMEEGCAAENTITDAGALADKDFIGFAVLEAAPTVLQFTYKKAGQTVQVPIATVATLTAAAWGKYGFVYNPAAPLAKRIKVYANSTELTTYVTGTQIAAATFPNGEEMQPIFGCKNVTDIMALDVDWWAMYQEG